MIILLRGNVERVVSTEHEAYKLIADGFKKIGVTNDEEENDLEAEARIATLDNNVSEIEVQAVETEAVETSMLKMMKVEETVGEEVVAKTSKKAGGKNGANK